MTQLSNRNLDFDHLLQLAERDPMRFEDMRQAAIDDFIAALPQERQQRMRQLQWRIDQERRNRSPISACVKISSMMWDHMVGPQGLLGYLQGDIRSRSEADHRACKVLDFPIRPSRQ
ncbi:DUF3135 domain-containing protein [Candidatus Thiodiazotropha sp. CDECU1]|uniref:DUF3135 domain-containing protein n=1 Tax=Candidatus Thiodiazotropha sp. CDECU1 TaxID=3065865 RepID=UPI00292F60C2|nr:DUF3135 domain-containing protein [Candidatus Thiodiazotropha sp. CDECU1]